MELQDLPIIDWDQAVKLAGNKKDLAKDILAMLVANISHETIAIKEAYSGQNYAELLRNVHKLHGALCYCGLPRLKTVIEHLETNLKNNIMVNLPSLLDQFDAEVNLLLERYPRLDDVSCNGS